VIIVAGVLVLATRPDPPKDPVTKLPVTPASYLGIYAPGVPASYAAVQAFTSVTDVRPDVVLYYSGWFEPFQTSFAVTAEQHHAIPLVQINPTKANMAGIAEGWYDRYLRAYAQQVRSYGGPVILSFGHEMNAPWYSWGYGHTSPAVFVAAWRHIVMVFRAAGARNVTWLWTVNVVGSKPEQRPSITAWWPGRQYVNWVGMDGYYINPATKFAQLFGPTIVEVREVTKDPILVSETSAAPGSGQAAKIADLFAGIRAYGLLGFVWFDANANRDYRISGAAAVAAFRQAASGYHARVF
jgi:hypothetical protein